YVADHVDMVVRRVGRDVVAGWRWRDAVPELPRDLRDVADDVHERIVVDVRRPRVSPARPVRVRSGRVLDRSPEAVAVRVARWHGPRNAFGVETISKRGVRKVDRLLAGAGED